MSGTKVYQDLRAVAIPATIGIALTSFVNATDAWFAARLSSAALAAVGVVFPAYIIISSVGIGVSRAISAQLGAALGSGDDDRQKQEYSSAAATAAWCGAASIIFSAIALVLLALLVQDAEVRSDALKYGAVLVIGSPFIVTPVALNGILLAQGDAATLRNSYATMTVINVVLDPLLAYGWGPIPAFGVVGIACATIALYVLAGAYIWIRILRSDLGKLYSLSRSSFRGRLSRSLAVFSVRSALDQLLLAATVALVIGFTAIAGDEAVAGYTAGSRVEQFIVLVVLGLNVGAIVVAARLLGARDYTRLSELFRLLLALAVIVGAVGMFILLALASQISSLMLESEPIASLTTTYLRIAAIGLPAQCTAIVCGGLLVGLQHMKLALRLNIIRLILVPLLVVGVTVVAIDTSASTIWWSYVGSIWATAGLLVARTKQVLSVVVLSGPTS